MHIALEFAYSIAALLYFFLSMILSLAVFKLVLTLFFFQVISQEAFRATPARWYILFAFCYMGMIQGFVGKFCYIVEEHSQ